MLHVVTPPAVQPLDWEAQVKSHLRLDSEQEKERVMSVLVPAADQLARSSTNLSLVDRTLKLTLDEFPCSDRALELPRAPLKSVTHVKYIDGNGVQQTWSTGDYVVSGKSADYPPPDDSPPSPGLIYPAYGKTWPATRSQRNAVEVQYVAGYGATHESIPALLRAGMLLIVGELFERREHAIVGAIITEVPLAATRLFAKFRVPKFREGWAA